MNKNNEWYTPSNIIELAREVMGSIDTDPASCAVAQEVVQAGQYFTEETDGLKQYWTGNVFCNPPYSAALIKKFTAKMLLEYECGNMKQGIILTNSGTDTLWNDPLKTGLQVYTNGRLSFRLPDGTFKGKGSRGSCITYFGDEPNRFVEVFTRNDFCWMPNQTFSCIHG